MKTRHLVFIFLAVLGSLLLTACSGRGASNTWPGLTANGSFAYMADGSQIYVVDLTGGRDVMTTVEGQSQPLRFPIKVDSKLSFYATPVLTPDGQLIVGSAGSAHELYSLDPKTLNQNWVFADAHDTYVGGALAANDMIYAPNSDGVLYALDPKGKLVWKFAVSGHGFWAQPVTDGKLVYAASLDHYLYALSAGTGEKTWSKKLDGALASAPAHGPDNTLYISTLNKSLYALNTGDGSVRWQKSLSGWVWSSPVLDGGVLYYGVAIGSEGGALQAADPDTGKILWTFDANGAVVGSPLVMPEQIVIVTEPGVVYGVNRSGGQIWMNKDINEKLYTSPYDAGDSILIATVQANKLLFALSPDGSTIRWSYEPGK
jgi:outer membrane protein assembly factor BamB